jgi:hypothetical protein
MEAKEAERFVSDFEARLPAMGTASSTAADKHCSIDGMLHRRVELEFTGHC